MHPECGSCYNWSHVTEPEKVIPTEQHIHEDCTRCHSCRTKVFHVTYADGE